ncbi:MAG: PAS domain-containing protein [Candidatus ainarchaeum sp.]|nr:PAS domain-containing protein [Candidatus ainarchaeum sp.]
MRIRSKIIILLLIVGLIPLVLFEILSIEVIKEQMPVLPEGLLNILYSLSGMLAVFFALFMVLAGLVISNSITKPLEKLTKVVDDISKGALESSINPKLKESHDEIGDLANAFDRTLVSLKLAMKQSSPELKKRLEEKNASTKELAETERLFHAFMSSTRMVAWIKDTEGRFVYVNRSFEKTFNKNLQELVGKTDADIFPKKIAETLHANDAEVLRTGRNIETEEQVPAPDGTLRRWQVFKFPLSIESERKYIGGFALEIKKQRSKK